MNKTIIAIIIIVILAVGGYFLFMKKDSGIEGAETNNMEQKQVSGEAQKGSLKDLLARGTPQKCTISSDNELSVSDGTFYVGNGKVRGDFTSSSNGQTFQGHMITDSEYMYTWMDSLDMGFKAKVNIASSAGNNQSSEGVDINKQISWDCDSWNPDASVFELPAGIQFQDLSTIAPQ